MGCCCSKEEIEDEETRTPLLKDLKRSGNHQDPETTPKYQACEDVPSVIVKQPTKTEDTTTEKQITEEPPVTSAKTEPEPVSESIAESEPVPESIPEPTECSHISISPVIVPEVHQKLQEQADRFNQYLEHSQQLKTTVDELEAMYPENNPDKSIEKCFLHVKDLLGTNIAEFVTLSQRAPHFFWLEYKADKVHHSLLTALNSFNKSNRLVNEILEQSPLLVSSVNEVLACENEMHSIIQSSSLKTDESIRRFDESIKQFKLIEPTISRIKNETLEIAELLKSAVDTLGLPLEAKNEVTDENQITIDSTEPKASDNQVLSGSPTNSESEPPLNETNDENMQDEKPLDTTDPESTATEEPEADQEAKVKVSEENLQTKEDEEADISQEKSEIKSDEVPSAEVLEESVVSGKEEFHSVMEGDHSVEKEEKQEPTDPDSDPATSGCPHETFEENVIGPAQVEQIETSMVSAYEDTVEEQETQDDSIAESAEGNGSLLEPSDDTLNADADAEVDPASPEDSVYTLPSSDTVPSGDWQTADSGATSDEVPTISGDGSGTEDDASENE